MTGTFDKADAAWGRIIPFLRPIEALIRDPEISDIMINGEQAVFFEKHGRMERMPGVSISEKALQVAARNIARSLGDEISEARPLLDSRLPDGSRVAIILFPVSVGGTSLTIRKFQNSATTPRNSFAWECSPSRFSKSCKNQWWNGGTSSFLEGLGRARQPS